MGTGTVVDLGQRWANELRAEVAETAGNGRDDDSWLHDAPDVIPQRRPIDWSSLGGREPPERTWIIPNWLTHGVTLLAGSGGAGKSYVMQAAASSIALGECYISAPVEPRRVLLWNCEDDEDELWRRQAALARHFGVGLEAFGNFHAVARVGLPNSLIVNLHGRPTWTDAYAELKAQVRETRAEVVMLDNLGHLYSCNENIRGEVTTFVAGLHSLADWPIAVVLAGHPAKATGSEYSGSTAWENAARMRWFLGSRLPDQQAPDEEVEADETIRYLCKRKANYSASDYVRLRWADNAIIPDGGSNADSASVSAPYRQEAARRLILAALRQFNDAGLRCVAGHTSREAYLIRRMMRQRMAEDLTKAELTRALEQLMLEQKVVEREFGRGKDRHPQTGLFVAF